MSGKRGTVPPETQDWLHYLRVTAAEAMEREHARRRPHEDVIVRTFRGEVVASNRHHGRRNRQETS